VNSSHNARDLSPDARQVVEQLLGRQLAEDEQISILAYKLHEPATADDKQAALDTLRKYWSRMDEKTKDIPEEEMDEILDEAMRSVRPNYRRIT
jgi:hypothetical protein